jgi:hypothetical protein
MKIVSLHHLRAVNVERRKVNHRRRLTDLQDLYEIARSPDATLQAAEFERDTAREASPQALAQLLPQVSAKGSAALERLGYANAQLGPVATCA